MRSSTFASGFGPAVPLCLIVACALLLWSVPALEAAAVNCPALAPPPPGDQIINVQPAEAANLPSIVSSAQPYTTILLADGFYSVPGYLAFNSEHVTLRSASGNRDAVVLDGGYQSSAAELIYIAVDHATVADLTLQRAWYHPVHIVGGGDYATLYNLKIIDGRQQFVKVNPSGGAYADFGLAACNELQLTNQGRTFIHDNPTPGFLCYTGGFDLHQTWGWVIRDNVITDIHCTNGGLAEHAIHFFKSNRDPVVERNLIIDSARGIGFGLGQEGFVRQFPDDPFAGTEMEGRENEVMQIGGVIQNNSIFANIGQFYDSGISLESAWKPLVLHNSIYSADGSFNSAIDVRFSGSESVVLSNNLYYPRITLRNGAPNPTQAANLLATADLFHDLSTGDLHLAATANAAIDQGVDTGLADDIDGNLRDASPDVGADEWVDTNTQPFVAISSPTEPAVFAESTWIDFAALATDLEDGDLTSSLAWTSSLGGPLGTGGAITVTLAPGLHTVQAAVTDSAAMAGWDEVEVGVTTPSCPDHLLMSGETVTGQQVGRAVFSVTVGPGVAIQAPGELTLKAGQKVVLGDGFTVHENAVFSATLAQDSCSP